MTIKSTLKTYQCLQGTYTLKVMYSSNENRLHEIYMHGSNDSCIYQKYFKKTCILTNEEEE